MIVRTKKAIKSKVVSFTYGITRRQLIEEIKVYLFGIPVYTSEHQMGEAK